MNGLDRVSYCLSYTDVIPVVNLVSGSVHLICAIRDGIWGAPIYKAPTDFYDLTESKLDDWTHLSKAAAIFSIVSTVFLIKNAIERPIDLDYIKGALPRDLINGVRFDSHVIPNKLFNHRDWLEAAFKWNNGYYFSMLFKKALQLDKIDKEFALSLINQGIFNYWADFNNLPSILKQDREIAIAFTKKAERLNSAFFSNLPEHLRSDLTIAKQVYSNLKSTDTSFVRFITDKEMLKKDENLCSAALEHGVLRFKNLDPEQQKNPDYAIAAMDFDHRQWADFSEDMQRNSQLLKEILRWFNYRRSIFGRRTEPSLWRDKVINDYDWFQRYWASKHSTSSPSQLALKKDLNSVQSYFPHSQLEMEK